MPQTLSVFLRNVIFRNRIALSFTGAAVFLYFASPSRTSVIAGIPFIILGEFMRTWASGHIKKNEVLSQTGPYAITRNPLYLGNALIGAGFSIMTSRVLLFLLFLAAFIYIYKVTIQNEEAFLSVKFGDAFSRYKKHVPAFFPVKIFCFSAAHDRSKPHFSWKLVIDHREYHTWLGIIAGIIIFLAKLAFKGSP